MRHSPYRCSRHASWFQTTHLNLRYHLKLGLIKGLLCNQSFLFASVAVDVRSHPCQASLRNAVSSYLNFALTVCSSSSMVFFDQKEIAVQLCHPLSFNAYEMFEKRIKPDDNVLNHPAMTGQCFAHFASDCYRSGCLQTAHRRLRLPHCHHSLFG